MRIQGFDDQKLKKCTAEKNYIFYIKKLQLRLPSPHKVRPGNRTSFHPQKRTLSITKFEILSLYMFLWVIFALPDPDPA
jgi:hypothetical protein